MEYYGSGVMEPDKRPRRQKRAGRLTLCALLLALSLPAQAQQPAKVFKIGFLDIGSALPRYQSLRRILPDLGYVEGKNISFEYRSADNKLDRLPALAEELIRLDVDVLVTRGTPEALALKNATRTIPIVFYDVTDPIAAGLIDSLARPGGNITGFTGLEAVLAGKRLELLKETVAKLSRVAVLWNPQDLSSAQQWKAMQLPARDLRLQLHSMEVSNPDKYDSAFREATKARSRALAVIAGGLEGSNVKKIADLAIKNRLPAIYPRPIFVEGGGLMSYGRDPEEANKRVPIMVDKILKGTKPADIPVEQPTKFELVINFKTAKTLGLTIPPIVLMRATKVIK
ncbi:MAG: ABC transporter substrate-binding protein [Candidatus Binatia bacterium]